jgi:hypothetical protein
MNSVPGRGYGGWFGRGFGRGLGRGFGRGLGFGRGRAWRSWFGAAVLPDWVNPEDTEYPPAAMRPEDEKKMLSAQVSELEKQLEAVNQRLSELEEK